MVIKLIRTYLCADVQKSMTLNDLEWLITGNQREG